MPRLSRLGRSTAGRTTIVTEVAHAIRSHGSINGVILPVGGGMTTKSD